MLLHLSSFPVLGENTGNVTALPDIAQRQGFLTYSWLSTSLMICTQVDLLTAKTGLKRGTLWFTIKTIYTTIEYKVLKQLLIGRD